jgi:putative DNA primase/helicase
MRPSSTNLIYVAATGHGEAPSLLTEGYGVVTSELPKGKRYDEATLKLITGGDEVTACHKYGNNFRYYPSFKLFMSTNFPPVFSAGDDALWNRAKTVPFRFSFKTYAGADKSAKDRLKDPAHRAGILAWAMTGCREWCAAGLQLPQAVEAETNQHRRAVDVIQAFLEERCELDTAVAVPVSNQELHRAYKAWSREQPVPQPMAAHEFAGEMQRAGYALIKTWGSGKKVDRWQGLRLKGDRE